MQSQLDANLTIEEAKRLLQYIKSPIRVGSQQFKQDIAYNYLYDIYNPIQINLSVTPLLKVKTLQDFEKGTVYTFKLSLDFNDFTIINQESKADSLVKKLIQKGFENVEQIEYENHTLIQLGSGSRLKLTSDRIQLECIDVHDKRRIEDCLL